MSFIIVSVKLFIFQRISSNDIYINSVCGTVCFFLFFFLCVCVCECVCFYSTFAQDIDI